MRRNHAPDASRARAFDRLCWLGLAVYFAICAMAQPGYSGAMAALCAWHAGRTRCGKRRPA